MGYGTPIVFLGGGGYTIENVSRCWAYETSVILGTYFYNFRSTNIGLENSRKRPIPKPVRTRPIQPALRHRNPSQRKWPEIPRYDLWDYCGKSKRVINQTVNRFPQRPQKVHSRRDFHMGSHWLRTGLRQWHAVWWTVQEVILICFCLF
jgi:hypothetical protein